MIQIDNNTILISDELFFYSNGKWFWARRECVLVDEKTKRHYLKHERNLNR